MFLPKFLSVFALFAAFSYTTALDVSGLEVVVIQPVITFVDDIINSEDLANDLLDVVSSSYVMMESVQGLSDTYSVLMDCVTDNGGLAAVNDVMNSAGNMKKSMESLVLDITSTITTELDIMLQSYNSLGGSLNDYIAGLYQGLSFGDLDIYGFLSDFGISFDNSAIGVLLQNLFNFDISLLDGSGDGSGGNGDGSSSTASSDSGGNAQPASNSNATADASSGSYNYNQGNYYYNQGNTDYDNYPEYYYYYSDDGGSDSYAASYANSGGSNGYNGGPNGYNSGSYAYNSGSYAYNSESSSESGK